MRALRSWPLPAIVFVTIAIVLALFGIDLWALPHTGAAVARNSVGAVCGSDSSCATWEYFHRVPRADRCYGAPCPRE